MTVKYSYLGWQVVRAPPSPTATAGQLGERARRMKVSVVSLLVFLVPCHLGYGLNLLSLLMGKQTEEVPDYDDLYETRENQNVETDGVNPAGYGLNLLSFLMGKLEEEDSATDPELSHSDHLYETREAKNVNIKTDKEVGFLTEEGSNSADHLYETREAKEVDIETGGERGLLDTLNLSLAGNLDISNAVGQVSIDGLLSPL